MASILLPAPGERNRARSACPLARRRVAGSRHEDVRPADVRRAARPLPAHAAVEQAEPSGPQDAGDVSLTRSKIMSLLTVLVVNAVLAGAILVGLAVVSWLPFGLDRSESSDATAQTESVPLAA
jgi:hypothetical protein